MNSRSLIIRTIIFLIIGLSFPGIGQTLNDNLEILQPLLDKKWTGELRSPDGSAFWKTTREFKILWDGSVVKYIGSTPEIETYSEGYFFWDRHEQKIAVLIVNNRGIYQRGFVNDEDGAITIKGTISFPERTFEFKNTFKFTSDGKMIDRWFQNAFGTWQPGHVIEFKSFE